MGSLTSRPKVPTQTVIYRTAPTTSVTTVSTSSAESTSNTQNAENTTSEAEQAARSQSLLQRERGRLGTVQTSFRGLLGLTDTAIAPRKTLLGQ
ncbi:MAG: hypothetical protein ACPGRX_00930 [Bdellovibrionales bacterium]